MTAWIIVLHLVTGDVILPRTYRSEIACEEAAIVAVVTQVKKGKDFNVPTYSCRPPQVGEKLQIGDYVARESRDGLQFESKPVTGLSDDGGFAFVEGSSTALPINELRKVAPPVDDRQHSHEAGPTTLQRLQPRPGTNTEVFSLEEGEVTIQWPTNMSSESYKDFKEWLNLIDKKIKRTADKKDAQNESRKSAK